MAVVCAWTKDGVLMQYNTNVPVPDFIHLLESTKYFVLNHAFEDLD